MENKSRYLKYGLHIVVFAGLVWAIVKYVNGEEVLQALQNFNYIYLPVMLVMVLGYFLLKAGRFVLLMSPFTENIRNIVIYKGYIAGQAATLIPGGVAARAGLMNQIGIPVSQSTVPVAAHSAWDQAVFLLGGLIAALWFPAARLPVLIILGVLVVVAALLLIPKTRNGIIGIGERIAERFDFEEQWHRFLNAIPQVFTKKLVFWSFILTVIAFALQIAILGLALRGLDLEVSIPTLFLAYIVPTMLGRMVPVPGGIGVTEVGMVGFLTSNAQLNTNTTVAAVAIFRIVVIVVPAVLGAIVYYLFWKGEDEVTAAQAEDKSYAGETAEKTPVPSVES